MLYSVVLMGYRVSNMTQSLVVVVYWTGLSLLAFVRNWVRLSVANGLRFNKSAIDGLDFWFFVFNLALMEYEVCKMTRLEPWIRRLRSEQSTGCTTSTILKSEALKIERRSYNDSAHEAAL